MVLQKYSGIRNTSFSGVLNRRPDLSNLSEQPWALNQRVKELGIE